MITSSYHFDNIVQIDGEWATMGGRNFKIEDIEGVAIEKLGSDWVWLAPVVFLELAIFIVISAISYALASHSTVLCMGTLALGIAFLVVLNVAIRARLSPPVYLIRLKGVFGEVNAFICADEEYAEDIVKATRAATRRKAH